MFEKLEVGKIPSYLSPSGLIQFEKCPNTFFLERMAQDPDPRDEQGPAAAAGSAFDYFIKIELARELGRKSLELGLEGLRKTLWDGIYREEDKLLYQGRSVNDILWCLSVEPQHRGEMAPIGKYLLDIYKKNGYDPSRFKQVEIHKKYMLQFAGFTIPIIGKGDALVNDEVIDAEKTLVGAIKKISSSSSSSSSEIAIYPFDWKVKGYSSASGASPTAGYYCIWEDGEIKGSHKNYVPDIPFESISDRYAVQLAVYGWQCGLFGKDFPAFIDEIVIRPNKIRVAKFRGIITRGFQAKLAERFFTCWRSLQNGDFVNSLPPHPKLVEMQADKESWF